MMVPYLTDTSSSSWSYISEGGATIVFAYKGDPNPTFERTVLRLKKRKHTQINHRSEDVDKATAASLEFYRQCMTRLVPLEHLPRMECVELGSTGRAWLENLSLTCEPLRPPRRRKIDSIDTHATTATIATDLIGSAQIAVEIKPKWGFLPSPTYLSEASKPAKTGTCRFCMHSRVKARESATPVALEYCPLDLYSADEARVTRALGGLWDAWTRTSGAINNFRVFAEGKPVDPCETSVLSSLFEHSDLDIKHAMVSLLCAVFQNTRILDTLSRLQRTLDPLDVEGLKKIVNPIDSPGYDPSTAEWTAFISQYLSNPPPAVEATNSRYYILAYLLSATFKDCSIIVQLPKGVATIIDLDVKSIHSLDKWEQLDREIVDTHCTLDSEHRKFCFE